MPDGRDVAGDSVLNTFVTSSEQDELKKSNSSFKHELNNVDFVSNQVVVILKVLVVDFVSDIGVQPRKEVW